MLYSSPAVLCSVSTVLCMSIPPCRRWRLVKVMHGRPRVRMGRLTNAYQHGRPNQNPSVLACGIPYQTLPDPVLAVRNPLVHLVWCGVRLPLLTNPPFWLGPMAMLPLPTSASGSEGLDQHSTVDREHSTEDTAGDEHSTVGHSHTARAMWHSTVTRCTQSGVAHTVAWSTLGW